jgi:6-phosphogluconolactonase (cycloisomerase 2 family)
MKIGKWARLLLAALPLVAGCKGFWDAPSGSGGGGTTTTTLSSGNFYILDKETTASQILGFSIVSGKLTALSGSPYAATGVAYSIALGPANSGYLYVSSTAGVYLYTINSTTGALTQGAQVSQDTIATAIQVDPGGKWLLEALATGSLDAVPITSTGAFDNGGTRTEQQVALAGIQVQQMAIAPNGAFVAVAMGSLGTQVFPFTSGAASNPIGGALTFGTAKNPYIVPVNTASAGAAIAASVDPQSRFLYVGETAAFPTSTASSGGLRIFSVAAPLAIAELATSPYASGGTGPHAIQPNAAGDFVYVASWQGTSAGLITPFQVSSSGTTYTLTALTNTVATGIEPAALAEDDLSHFMLAVSSSGTPTFSAYIFDTTTVGKLDLTNTDSTATSPIAVVAP